MNIIELIAQLKDKDIRLWLEQEQLRFSAPKGGMDETTRTLLAEHKQALVSFLQQAETAQLPTITPQPKGSWQPLSSAQQRLWFISQLEPDSTALHIHSVFEIFAALEASRVQQVLNRIIERHTILRTAYRQTPQGVMQQVLENQPAQLQLEVLNRALSEAELQQRATEAMAQPFELAAGEVMHNQLLQLGEAHFVLISTIHHIAADGWSMPLLAREFVHLYQGDEKLPELALQYRDYAAWQAGLVQHQQPLLQQAVAELKGIEPLQLARGKIRPPLPDSRGASVSFRLDNRTTEALNRLAREQDVTLFMLLLTLFGSLLYRYSFQRSFCIGTPVAGRSQPQLENLIGCFVNLLPIKTEWQPEQPFTQALQRIREHSLTAFARQDLAFENLVQALQTSRDFSMPPLFQVLFSLQNLPQQELTQPGFSVQAKPVAKTGSLYDLSLTCNEWQGEILCEFDYKTCLFDAGDMEAMAANFQRLIAAVLHNPGASLSRMNMLAELQKQRQLQAFTESRVARELLPGIADYISQQAGQYGERTAVRFASECLSYAELEVASNRLAYFIQQNLPASDTPALVGVYLPRSLELPAVLLAILKAGAGYLPLDTELPQQRLDDLAAQTGISLLLTQSGAGNWQPQPHIRQIDIHNDAALWRELPAERPKAVPGLVNVIFTSGSTGQPKGVMMGQQALLNRLLWMQETFPLKVGDKVLQKTPYSFDVSVWEFFWPLMQGAELVLANPEGHKDADYLCRLIRQQGISHLHFVPSMLNQFLQTENLEACASIQRVFCSGETLLLAQVQRFYQRLPAAQLVNLYGPTEAAIDVSYHHCSSADQNVPIGRAISNTELLVLGEQQQLLPAGCVGEIYIGGAGLAEGYWQQPELTRVAFVAHPFRNGERLYRTGDLGFWGSDGELHFAGRQDAQVKIRGMRVELDEIRNQLATYPGLEDCLIIAREVASFDLRLQAYYLAPAPLASETLRQHLQARLPAYMVPAAFIHLHGWPRLINGKIDRAALPDPERSGLSQASFVAPRDNIEQTLADIWQDLLKLEKIGIYDNFFELGGHSLLAAQALSRAEQALAVRIALGDAVRDPSIATLADVVRQQLEQQSIRIGDNDIADDEEEITL